MFKLGAEPKRWISVTAPLWAWLPLSPGLLNQKAGDDAVDDAQHGREQFGMVGRGTSRAEPGLHVHLRSDLKPRTPEPGE
jgi:hypothetical protein